MDKDNKPIAVTTAGSLAIQLFRLKAEYTRALELVDLQVSNRQKTLQEAVAMKTGLIKLYYPKMDGLAKALIKLEDSPIPGGAV